MCVCVCVCEGGRRGRKRETERERENPKQALHCTEPNLGLDPRNREIVTRAKILGSTSQLTEPPRHAGMGIFKFPRSF